MRDIELFLYAAVAFGWVVYQVIRRVLQPPRPLGTIADEAAPDQAVPEQAGRALQPPPPAAVPPEPFPWGRDAAQAELAAARELARRQDEARRAQQLARRPRRHPHRPQLHSRQGLRHAVVAAAVLGPCRAMEPYRPPH